MSAVTRPVAAGTELVLRVVRGAPTEEEVAAIMVALIGLLAAGAAGSGAGTPAPASGQARASRRVGWSAARRYHPPGAWTSR